MAMKEMMMMMMIGRSSPENLTIEPPISSDPITTTSSTNCPTWKLYENPFYTCTPPHKHLPQNHINHQLKPIHRLHLPISTRKIAASFWDLTFIRPLMESELEMARAKITELKAELEQERKARKRAESLNKKLAREVSEARKGREALERLCEEFAKQVSSEKAEMNRMQRDMEEERKMLRMAEVLREERVQMKLNEAKLLLEDKLSELEAIRVCSSSNPKEQEEDRIMIMNGQNDKAVSTTSAGGEDIKSCVLVEKSACNYNNIGSNHPSGGTQRRASPEPENPHIKRGIKGFVEFPKVVRALGSKSRHLGTKLECQKSQLRILLKQRTPIRSNTLITS